MTDLVFDRMPVDGPITQAFGILSVTGSKHGGVDIGANSGTPILAPAGGLLLRHTLNERAWDFGNWVVIDHPGTPWYSAYAHLSAFGAGEGQVNPGDIIGYVGETGVAFGAHLHWAVGTNPGFALDFAQLTDPMAFLAKEAELTYEQFEEYFQKAMGRLFPAYIEACFSGGFTARDGKLDPGEAMDSGPIKPWLDDIRAALRGGR